MSDPTPPRMSQVEYGVLLSRGQVTENSWGAGSSPSEASSSETSRGTLTVMPSSPSPVKSSYQRSLP